MVSLHSLLCCVISSATHGLLLLFISCQMLPVCGICGFVCGGIKSLMGGKTGLS